MYTPYISTDGITVQPVEMLCKQALTGFQRIEKISEAEENSTMLDQVEVVINSDTSV